MPVPCPLKEISKTQHTLGPRSKNAPKTSGTLVLYSWLIFGLSDLYNSHATLNYFIIHAAYMHLDPGCLTAEWLQWLNAGLLLDFSLKLTTPLGHRSFTRKHWANSQGTLSALQTDWPALKPHFFGLSDRAVFWCVDAHTRAIQASWQQQSQKQKERLPPQRFIACRCAGGF